MWDVFPDAVGSATYKALQLAMKENEFVFQLDYYAPLDLWQENYIYPSDNGLSVFIRDVSEQKRIEFKLRENEKIYKSIAASIPGTLICLFDSEDKYILVEGDLIEKLGYDGKTLLGKKISEMAHDRRAEFLIRNIAMAREGLTVSAETKVAEFELLYKFTPLKDERQKVQYVMLVGVDITKQIRAQQRSEQYSLELEKLVSSRTSQLEAINKELESFSYSVAHDLRTPLRALSGYATMLQEDNECKLTESGLRFLQRLQYNAEKMTGLIDDLLNFSQLGRKELRSQRVDMKALAEEAVEELRNAESDRCDVKIGELHPTAGDSGLLKLVLINLLSNAIKYSSKKEKPEVKVSSEEKEHEVIFKVKDNGVGFDMTNASRLFGVFQRLHTEDEFPGTGVGLASVARIVHRHGGRVWAEAAPEAGAEFCFTIPTKRN
jgi:PAS domain S-box-containing protein